jgi:hypothetical protein
MKLVASASTVIQNRLHLSKEIGDWYQVTAEILMAN